MAGEDENYHPKDAIGTAVQGGLTTGVVGAIASGVQAALTKQNIGILGTFTKYGGTTAVFAGMGASYMFVRNVTANLRHKDDLYSSALGGFVAGSIVGVSKRSLPSIIGIGALGAVLTGTMTATHGLRGRRGDPDADILGEKDVARRTYRRPVAETIAELGEGRGIYGPGYEERRKQRLKETYGIEVP
ncbi:hypothetical protein BT63DRAFT_429023 [Microthyrium microscopicum]|uniref:NADH-ubiquinone oxidoreductase 213 kDa subunit n=1 Tax=Microthyrium microscopicum TaxID=703497 RepID=A0A6A6U294_9PEZI|nr:hypothetical protein BT63DRAFT_429023 [Microthyrium microscopicum]